MNLEKSVPHGTWIFTELLFLLLLFSEEQILLDVLGRGTDALDAPLDLCL